MQATIRLNKQNKTIKVVNRKENIRLTHTRGENVRLEHTGRRGPVGPQGEPGLGFPEGGEAGDILKKLSSDDYDTVWAQPTTFSDKHFVANFSVTDSVAVQHNLNKYPSVSVIDTAGDEVYGQVDFLSTNSIRVRFTNPFSGMITCN